MSKAEIGRAILEGSQGSPLERVLANEVLRQLDENSRLTTLVCVAALALDHTLRELGRFPDAGNYGDAAVVL